MAEAPKTVPTEVIDALKRGDKAGAMKALLQGKQVTSLKDVMHLLEQLQSSGAVKAAVKVKMAGPAHPGIAPAHHAHPKPVVSVPSHPGGLSPGEMPRTSAKGIGFVVVVVIALVFIWFALK